MASSPKTGSERADSPTSAIEPTSPHPATASQASEGPSLGHMAAFKEKIRASLAAKNARLKDEARPTVEPSVVPDGVPRDADGKLINPGGRMILTPPDTQDGQTPSDQEKVSSRDVKSG